MLNNYIGIPAVKAVCEFVTMVKLRERRSRVHSI